MQQRVDDRAAIPRNPGPDSVCAIIPTYNSADTLRSAVDSVLNQTRAADEILVVDDGSTDSTADVCRGYDDALTYIKKENAGASAARNTGARAARGRWLAFLDADDVWDPEKLEIQLAALEQRPEADFAITAALAWSAGEQAWFKYEWTGSLDPRALRRELLVRNVFTGLCSSIVIERDAFLAVGGFTEGKLSEDRRLAIDLLATHRGLILPHALIRQRPGPASFSDPEKMRRGMFELINDYLLLYSQLDRTGRLFRRARARVFERAAMHYLGNGEHLHAARDFARAASIWPFTPDPWRFFVNACLGRLRKGTPTPLASSSSGVSNVTLRPVPAG
ncbi:MAG TPA: glycosyltransferase family 2 protein [Phycisphaerae bacterium]|nr:glycosyltransferase family 2 protein [Phycisphaerae bacterium]